jgi:hypothetical protein
MARRKRHNPEKRAWKGRSYKAAGRRVSDLRAVTPQPETPLPTKQREEA